MSTKKTAKHFNRALGLSASVATRLVRALNAVLAAIIILRPLISSFFGIDIGDTGLHYTNFKYLFTRPDIVGYSSVLTSVIGHCWLVLFGGLGIWGLNLLEVFVEWLISGLTYHWMTKQFDKTAVLLGITVSSISCGTYLNIFNYHQFSVLLVLCFLFCLFTAINTDSPKWSFLAGVVFVAAVLARIVNVVCVCAFVLFFYQSDSSEKTAKPNIALHCLATFFGALSALAVSAAFIVYSGLGEAFLGSMSRLGGMATSSSSTYSLSSLLVKLVGGCVKALASPLILIGAAALVFIALKLFKMKNIVSVLLGLLCVVSIPILVRFSFNVNPVDGSPQLSTGPNFITGVVLFAGIACAIQSYHNRERFLTVAMGVLLAIISLSGSNTGTKHIVISMWMLAPLVVYELFVLWEWLKTIDEKSLRVEPHEATAVVLFLVAALSYKMFTFVKVTNNFDSTNRFELTEPVDSDNYSFLRTTQREADALNGLCEAYKAAPSNQIVVFGFGLGIYPLLDAEPYSRAWVTDPSFSAELFRDALFNNSNCPPIVYCRTNQYFGYSSWRYDEQISQIKQTTFAGKKDLLKKFLLENGYRLSYQNDYYFLFEPTSRGGVTLSDDLLADLLG